MDPETSKEGGQLKRGSKGTDEKGFVTYKASEKRDEKLSATTNRQKIGRISRSTERLISPSKDAPYRRYPWSQGGTGGRYIGQNGNGSTSYS